jgi:long-chain acyl-CoA synthetase
MSRILRHLLRHPLRTAVVDDQHAWRGIELYVAALHLARKIELTSACPRIGLLLPTSGLTPVAILATWMLGRTIVPINYLLGAADRDHILADAELDAVVTITPMIERFGDLPAHVRQIRLDAMSFKGVPPLRRVARPPADHVAALVYTSGTAGRPKGVMLTVGNLSANVEQCAQGGELPGTSVFLGVLPQFHCFGLTVLTLLPLALGAKVVYTARFVPRRVLELMMEHRPTVTLAVPSMLNRLLEARGATREHFASVKYLVSGGEPLPPRVFDDFRRRFGVTLYEGYGLTETSPVANWCRPRDHRRGSVGPPLPGVEEKIVAPDGSRLGVGEEGEVRIKGPNLMKGYHGLPEETAAAFDEEGFFKTGDMGRIDADGHLYITGRIQEMMVIGGENVFPRTIEAVLDLHPGVHISAVLGVPDPGRGQVPVAVVEPVAGAILDEAELRAHCRKHLPSYQVPRRVMTIERMPRSSTGKILRRELRVLLETRPPARNSGPSAP